MKTPNPFKEYTIEGGALKAKPERYSVEDNALYLDWFNNFLSVEQFARHYHLDLEAAHDLVQRGREWHTDPANFGD